MLAGVFCSVWVQMWRLTCIFLDNDPHFLDSHLCDLCFGIDSERLGEQSLRIEHWNP
jgi:hypothetical protein